ncbi:MAG TPA: hypothetical protein VEU32_18360 [Burkholderiales bacterium]|nr:hypothetical protein [Burkholderiales bacterium]
MTRLLPLLLGQAEEQELQPADMTHERSHRRQAAGFRTQLTMHGR